MLFLKFLAAFAVCAAGFALPAAAQDGASFVVAARPGTGEAVQVARKHKAFLKLEVRPARAVTLAQAIPAALASEFGAKVDVPLDPSLPLYGWPERPGLYCDLLRPRGLGMSSACLRDTDGDGRFDEGVRLDFHSSKSDLLVL